MHWIKVDAQGVIIAERVVAVSNADAAATKHLLNALPAGQIVGMTGGRKRASIVILDSGHAVITHLSIDEIVEQLPGTPLGR